MKKHLDKEKAYQSISTSVHETETSHEELCKRIQDIMISDAPISAMSSFQKIILDKIESACPTFKRSKAIYLTQDNIYLPFSVFKVFDTLYGKESTIALSEKTINNNKSQLWYGRPLGSRRRCSNKEIK
jgi:hypothetical protein